MCRVWRRRRRRSADGPLRLHMPRPPDPLDVPRERRGDEPKRVNRRPGPAGLDHGRRVSRYARYSLPGPPTDNLPAPRTPRLSSPPTRCRSDRDETPPPSTASSRAWGVGWLTRSASARGGAILRLQLSAGVACRPPAVRGLDAGVRSRHVDFLAEALARPARPYEFRVRVRPAATRRVRHPQAGPDARRVGRRRRRVARIDRDAAGLGADLGLEPDQPSGVRRGAGPHRRAAPERRPGRRGHRRALRAPASSRIPPSRRACAHWSAGSVAAAA